MALTRTQRAAVRDRATRVKHIMAKHVRHVDDIDVRETHGGTPTKLTFETDIIRSIPFTVLKTPKLHANGSFSRTKHWEYLGYVCDTRKKAETYATFLNDHPVVGNFTFVKLRIAARIAWVEMMDHLLAENNTTWVDVENVLEGNPQNY
jgi:hypothetical protein